MNILESKKHLFDYLFAIAPYIVIYYTTICYIWPKCLYYTHIHIQTNAKSAHFPLSHTEYVCVCVWNKCSQNKREGKGTPHSLIRSCLAKHTHTRAHANTHTRTRYAYSLCLVLGLALALALLLLQRNSPVCVCECECLSALSRA